MGRELSGCALAVFDNGRAEVALNPAQLKRARPYVNRLTVKG